MTKLILTGHGSYATGMLSALELVSGPKENVVAVDFTKEDTEESLLEKLEETVTGGETYLFVCDLMGGTPYKMAMKLAYGISNYEVVTGANLGGLLDTCFKLNQLDQKDLVQNLLVASKKNILMFEEPTEIKTDTDGI